MRRVAVAFPNETTVLISMFTSRVGSSRPLAPARFKVQFTASASLRDKLERLQALTGEDLAEAIEAAVAERVERLEARKYGATTSPRKTLADTDTRPSSRAVPAAVRRAVRERDGDRCRFVSANGKRCNERRGLEFHHHNPYGRGGGHDPETISLMCRTHNACLAEKEYGKEAMERYRRPRDGVREPAARYGFLHAGRSAYRPGVASSIGKTFSHGIADTIWDVNSVSSSTNS